MLFEIMNILMEKLNMIIIKFLEKQFFNKKFTGFWLGEYLEGKNIK